MIKHILAALLVLCLIIPVFAVPSTPAVANITAAGFNLSTTGDVTTVWFRWGQSQSYPEYTTPNQTATGNDFALIQGSPYFPRQTYYAQACDVSGCSGLSSPIVAVSPTPIPQSTYGNALTNITQSHFNTPNIITALPQPYMWALPSAWQTNGAGIALIAAMVFSGYFVGIWLRQRKVVIAVMLGMIIMSFLISPLSGLNWGLPAEWIELAEMLLYASMSGMFFSLLKKG
jgi:hypothetical protein